MGFENPFKKKGTNKETLAALGALAAIGGGVEGAAHMDQQHMANIENMHAPIPAVAQVEQGNPTLNKTSQSSPEPISIGNLRAPETIDIHKVEVPVDVHMDRQTADVEAHTENVDIHKDEMTAPLEAHKVTADVHKKEFNVNLPPL